MAVLMNQRTVWSGWGGVRFWAWTASIAVHLIALTAFGLVRFSQARTGGSGPLTPIARVSRPREFTQAAPVIPKPKVKRPANSRLDDLAVGWLDVPAPRRFGISRSKLSSRDLGNFAAPAGPQGVFSLPGGINPSKGVEFFGGPTAGQNAERRKVCYLVDCSGSMQGVFGQVRRKLKDSIADLQPDEYFYVIFFGGGELFESGNGRVLRATTEAKFAAYNFIDSIQSAGQTNATDALERAVQIRDGQGNSASVVYLLTDGFELTTEDAQSFSQRVASMLKRFAPATRIDTIGFWPQSDDRKMLEAIAKRSGGEFTFVADGDN